MEASTPQYAPPVRSRSSVYVIPAGLVTSAAVLAIVWWLDRLRTPINVMGYYADYVIPAGALLVGFAAGSGYGIASWYTGYRMEKKLLGIVVVLQILAYAAAQYVDFYGQHLVYRNTGQPIGFFEYYHLTTINIAWITHHGDEPGDPLGLWGYALRALEIAGFALGGLVVPAMLLKKPYCERCRVYMKTKKLPTFPASVPARKVKAKDTEGTAAYQAEQRGAADSGAALMDQLAVAGKTGDEESFRHIVQAAQPSSRKSEKLPRRLGVGLVYCRNCYSAFLAPAVLTGRGKRLKRNPLPTTPMPDTFVRKFLGQR